ncbi:MAG: hypothetical protein K0Q73_9091 [Paenibacillus sp.]|nr:hypothetical protein [Paenibacillus sp.]
MIAPLVIAGIGATMIGLQFKFLWKQRKKKEAFVCASISVIGIVLFVAILLELTVPSPLILLGDWIRPIEKPISDWVRRG